MKNEVENCQQDMTSVLQRWYY